MAKDDKWPDWSDLYKNGHVAQTSEDLKRIAAETGIDMTKDTKDSNKGGDKVTREQLIKEALAIVAAAKAASNPLRQPTNEELFGRLVPKEEDVKKAEDEWNNRFNNHFKALAKNIETPEQKKLAESWTSGKSFRESLTPEELAKYEKELAEFDKKIANSNGDDITF